ncbi:hypothetical protein AVEN_277-1 [Araneus ventricosus]|uniref:Uncharacterized protein n=1 Tax=Araneus ventricosus TaxID=182803 RepID=A0A4Y2CN07_ARAVE|nr:hypothetical protein AVEN_277-1 [Araneus ventricosus]
MDNKTGSAFCVNEEDITKYEWMAQLRLSTQSSKQSFLLYGRHVFGQARPTNRLRYSGNEAAEELSKKATQEGTTTNIPALRSHVKSLLQKECIIRWQTEWDNRETSRRVYNVLPKVKITPSAWQSPNIMFVTGHGPFLTYLKGFYIRNSDSCGCDDLGNPLHYATSYPLTSLYHLTKPSADSEPIWWKRVLNNNIFRTKIRRVIHVIAENEAVLFPNDGNKD